ncbi:Mis6-domain-containing protein [Cucurbitaria berberidis CBS 394.84]|uniref:Mis6-domain-containing protein n=1 Tax=Cucurbitaria berberidis CBS 394.84 TaxID=1168544 RepID=A0A9P4GFN3_9PLEO|nr:Mis6-domain-containing protein [Cucurbitaria berberidis CBS 394.84]KAF1844757.1 Mis6-domain-containing protein [Cucurbitaria berberidis CBS 394.84]
MPSIADEPPALHDALDLLHKASRTPAKQRTVKVSSIVDVICRHALQHGLDQDALRDVVQLASVKTNLDQTSVTTLVKNLYPAQWVPGDIIVTVVGALGQGKGKPSPATQDSLVKWLTAVHEIIEDANVLSRLYGVLFSMLDMISIRTSLCHLLSLITRRKHVKPFRIQQLLELSRGLGNEPALQGLLRVYKDYYPDIILGSTSTSRKSFSPRPDSVWRTRISAIQEASAATNDSSVDRHNGFRVLRKGPKRSKVAVIPEVHTYYATENSVTLEGIDNVEDFVEKLDRLEPPGQLVALLTDSLLQKYVELTPSPIVSTRIDLWLATCLEELYEAEGLETGDAQYLSEVLDGLLKHAQYTKAMHPTVLAFLKEYLPIWNGQENVDSILGLLSYIPIDSFKDVYSTYLSSAERALAGHGPSAHPKLIEFYSSLFQHQVSTTSSKNDRHSSSSHRVLKDLVAHVSELSTSLLLSLPLNSGSSLISSILGFYELLSTSSKPHVIPIILPPMHLIYLLAQNASSTMLSRVYGIIGSYKVAFDQHPKPVKDYYPVSVTERLNSCLRDLYNMLWVSRALSIQDQKSVGLYCDPSLRVALKDYLSSLDRDYSISTAFALSNNAWLASGSAAAWRALEERDIETEGYDKDSIRYHHGPVTPRSLEVLKRKGGINVEWDGPMGYKVFVLNWLAERGLSGIKQFMFATVTDLKGKV